MLTELKTEIDSETNNKKAKKNIDAIAELLKRNGIKPEDIGKVEKIGMYQMGYRDKDTGKPEALDLVKIEISPKFAEGPAWPVIQPAKPVTVKVEKRKSVSLLKNWKTAVFLPDPQFGYREAEGVKYPFHDEDAIKIATKVLQYFAENSNLTEVVNLGDYLDLPSMSKYIQEPGFASTTQLAIDEGYKFLAVQREIADSANIVILEGNHDMRMKDFVVVNAKAAFGLKKAQSPDSWPVMSVPNLLRCDELGVDYIDAYPAGQYWINDNLRAIHGTSVVSGGSTAAKYVKDYPGISTVFGHIHRIEQQNQTKGERKGKVLTFAASPGCLCRIDGAVPGFHSGTDLTGAPAEIWENWQQGIAWAHYTDDQQYYFQSQITDGKTIIEGQEISV